MLCKLNKNNISINIPVNVNINFNNNILCINNDYKFLELKLKDLFLINIEHCILNIKFKNDIFIKNKKTVKFYKSYLGTIKSLINNMITGVTIGFYKKIIICGIGYKVILNNDILIFYLGYSHAIKYKLPKEVNIKNISNNEIILFSYDKEVLGNVSRNIKMFKKIDLYKGKGIKYENDKIKLKNFRKK